MAQLKERLNEEQIKALAVFKQGKNIFLTGQAGTGKSYTLKAICQLAIQSKLNYAITSTTGVSVVLIGGRTIHSWAGIGLGQMDKEKLLMQVMKSKKAHKRWSSVRVLIIDEISMMGPDLFEKLNFIGQQVRGNYKPFGGIQLILTGDFAQLPPVQADFVFKSPIWSQTIHHVAYLRVNMRQTEANFQKLLSEVRLGLVTEETRTILSSRLHKVIEGEIRPTKLFSHRASVEDINKQSLQSLVTPTNPLWKFKSFDEVKSRWPVQADYQQQYIERLDKSCPGVKDLDLCVGAQVMLTFNLDVRAGLCNGSRGVIKQFKDNRPVVKFKNGLEVSVNTNTWELQVDDEIKVFRTQIPLILAWALTIHKAQGATIDCVELDMGSTIFEKGQAYTGLSRVSGLDGLTLLALDWKGVQAHPDVIAFYQQLDPTTTTTPTTTISSVVPVTPMAIKEIDQDRDDQDGDRPTEPVTRLTASNPRVLAALAKYKGK